MSANKTKDPSQRRKFIRLDSVFPVEFCFINKEDKSTLSEWMQGYTNNFSKGGICIEAHNISPQTLLLLQSAGASLSVRITVPFSHRKTEAEVGIRWFQESASDKGTYLIGVEYEKVDSAALGAMMGYVYRKKVIFPSIVGMGIAVGILALLLGYHGMELSKGKSRVERQAAEVSKQLHAVKEQFKQTVEERRELEKALMALRSEHKLAKEEKTEMAEVMAVQEEWLEKMDVTLKELQEEKDKLAARLSLLQDGPRTDGAVTDLQMSEDKIEALHRWLRTRQDPESGLIKSYLLTEETESGGAVFLSEQADVLQSFVLFSEFEEAEKLLKALKGRLKQSRGLFFDGYSMAGGKPLLENADSLSNMTLGIAILQYAESSGDSKYSGMVEAIADELIRWQEKSPGGGITFFENETGTFFPVNLTGYVFFDMLYEVTKDSKYEAARDKVYKAILSTLSEDIKAPYGELVFLTIGPEAIDAAGIDPSAAESLIEKEFFVEEELTDFEGKPLLLKGISFGFESDGLQPVSSLRTAQMALICDIMRGYYLARQMPDKAEDYENKRLMYLKTLSGMIIIVNDDAGESLGYLPDFYSRDFAEMIVKGVDIAGLSSISAVVNTIFAYYSYNPFVLVTRAEVLKTD